MSKWKGNFIPDDVALNSAEIRVRSLPLVWADTRLEPWIMVKINQKVYKLYEKVFFTFFA